MLIKTRVKRIRKVVVSATFEHQGVPYEDRFDSIGRFITKVKRTKDTFINAVVFTDMTVLNPQNISKYISSIKS